MARPVSPGTDNFDVGPDHPHDTPHGEIGTEWYQRAYRAFREWINDEPGNENPPEDTGQPADAEPVEREVANDEVAPVGLPSVVLGSGGGEGPEAGDPALQADQAPPAQAEPGVDVNQPQDDEVDSESTYVVENTDPYAGDAPVAAWPAPVADEPDLDPDLDPEAFEQEATQQEAAGQVLDIGIPESEPPEGGPELIRTDQKAENENEFETVEAVPRTSSRQDRETAVSDSGVHADSEEQATIEFEQIDSGEQSGEVIELVETDADAFAQEAAQREAAGQVVDAGQPTTPEDENAPELLGVGAALRETDTSEVELLEAGTPAGGGGKEVSGIFAGVDSESAQVVDPELLVREETEAAPELIEAEPVAQTAGERQVENVENPPQEGRLVSDPLVRAASKLTDPVQVGAANAPVGGLTRSDKTSGTDGQSLSAEGADGTSSTLKSGNGDSGGYEPPSIWDRIWDETDYDLDNNGVPDYQQDSDGDGIDDHSERWSYRNPTDPYNADTDGDGVKDGAELKAGTDPTVPDGPGDTDGDGIVDTDEIAWGYDPADPDTDDDGLEDGFEEKHGTFADNKDSDGDGIPDGEEDADGDGLTALEEQARGKNPNEMYTDPLRHDKTGLTRDETLNRLTSDRTDFLRNEAEADAAEAAAEVAAGPPYRTVTEGDAKYVFEGSNLAAEAGSMASGTAHVTEVETGNSISITQVPRGATIRLMNAEDIGKQKEHLIEDGREELPPDKRGIWQRFTDYRDGVKPEPAEEAPPGGEFERGGFDGEGEGEGDFPAFVGASGEWEPGAFEDRQREASADGDGDGTPDGVDPDSLDIERTSPDVEGANRNPASPFESDEAPLTPPGGDLGREMPMSTVEDESPVGQPVDPAAVFDEVRTRTPDPSGGPGESQSPGSDTGPDFENQGEDSVYRWEDDASSSGVQDESVGGSGSIYEETGSMGLNDDEQDNDPGASGGGEQYLDDDNDDETKLTEVGQFDSETGEGTDWFVDDEGNWYDENRKPIPAGDVPEDVREQNKIWTEQKQAADDANKNEPDDSTSTSGAGPANSVGPSLLPDDGDGFNPGGNIDRERGPIQDVPDDSWDNQNVGDEGEGKSSDDTDVSTSVDPLGGDGSSKAGREAAASVGAPQNGAQPLPVDPQRWDGGAVEGRDLKSMVTSDDLAQPGPENGPGGDHLRDNLGVDANASSGMFATGSIDRGPDYVDVQTDGPYQDDPTFPTAPQSSESESTQGPPLREVELGTALQGTSAARPGPPSEEHNYLGDPVGSSSGQAGSSSTTEDPNVNGGGPQRVGSDPAAGIDDEFVGRLEMSLATTGPNDTPLMAPDDTSDEGFGTGESDPPATKPDITSDESFGKGDPQQPSEADVPQEVLSPVIATAAELDGVAADKAEVLGISEDEPLVELEAEATKTDATSEDKSPADAEDLADVGKVDALDLWEA